MRASIIVVFVLIAAVIALVAFVPATWLDHRLDTATGGKIRLSDAEGPVWRGHGAIGDVQGNWRAPLAWRIAPLPLLRGAVDVELESQSVTDAPRGHLTFANDVVDARNVGLRVPASIVAALSSVKLPLEPGGEFVVEAPRFQYRPNQADGAFDVRWERARLATAQSALDLGTITARVAPKGSTLVGTLRNAGGDARIDGDVNLAPTGIAFRATIAPNGALPPDIGRLLTAVGTQDANGVVHLQWSARR